MIIIIQCLFPKNASPFQHRHTLYSLPRICLFLIRLIFAISTILKSTTKNGNSNFRKDKPIFKTQKAHQHTTLSALTGLTISLFKQLLNNPKQQFPASSVLQYSPSFLTFLQHHLYKTFLRIAHILHKVHF